MDSYKKKIITMGMLFVTLSFLSVKLSTPALPTLPGIFHTNPFNLKLAGMIYVLVYAGIQLMWGGISKFYPRRRIITIALSIAFVGTIVTLFSFNIELFIIGRVIEASGMGAGSCMCRVLMSDSLEKNEIAKASLFFGAIFSFLPFIAPTIGQYLMIFFDWHAIFVFSALAIITYFLIFKRFLPETKKDNGARFSFKEIRHDYRVILTHPTFWSYISGYALYIGLLLGYYMSLPYWYRVYFAIPETTYTLLALFTAVPNMIAFYFSRFIIKKWGTTGCLRITYPISLIAGLLILIFAFLFPSSPWTLIPPMMIISGTLGFIMPATNAGLLSNFRERSGVVSALIPVFLYTSGGLFFLLLSSISLTTLWPMTIILIAITTLGTLTTPLLKTHAAHL